MAAALSPAADAAAQEKSGGIKFEAGNAFPRSDFGSGPAVTPDAPVLIEADAVDYQHENGLVIASGNVAVTHGDNVLLADSLAYDQEADLLLAKGNVSMLDPSGNVYFADEAELTGDLKKGTVRQFKMRFRDNSLFAAARADKLDEKRTRLFRAAYSPCNCADPETGEPKTPQWALKAHEALVDQEAQKVVYEDVFFGLYDVPILYSPYFSHATPGADNKSGLLMPEYLHTQNIGSMIKMPVYYAIAPDRDATVVPIYTSLEGWVMAGEYRQQLDDGRMIFSGSGTYPQNLDANGNPVRGKEFRGNINGTGNFKLDADADWGFDIHATTDDTYLRRYNFSQDTLLVSRLYAQSANVANLGDRSYGSVKGLAFQGLTAADDQSRIPVILPLAYFTHESRPQAYNSRFFFEGNALSLYRDTGNDSRRLSGTAGWKLPTITADGQVIEFAAQLRGDAYSVNEVMLAGGDRYDGFAGRIVPQASVLWRYPFLNRGETSSVLVEPVVMAAVSPNGGNSSKIPNEDSLAPEFTDTNLFDPNRFAGYDRIETGPRVAYGLRGQAQFFEDKFLDWLFGQSYRLDDDGGFPYTNAPGSHFSDYVGKLGLTYRPLSVAYRFRFDHRDFAPKRHEVDLHYVHPWFNAGVSYLSLKNDPVLATREAITGVANLKLSSNWTLNLRASEDLLLNQVTTTAAGLTYQNECTAISGLVGREYTRDRDIKPSTSFLFRISLKNLE